MLLKELQPGQRFEFTDKHTPVAFLINGSRAVTFPATDTFTYKGVGHNAQPILNCGDATFEAVSGTYNREVLRIF